MKPFFRSLLLLSAVFLLVFGGPSRSAAQTTSASLTGVVADKTGARIPGATVLLRNTRTKDVRHETSNGTGTFQFNAVPTGTYTVTVTMAGFKTLVTKDVELHPNDNASLSELHMQIGTEDVSITVEANTDIATSGERSSLITAQDIQKLSTVGRDVSELLKTQVGFAVAQQGLDNSGSSSAEVAGTFSGLSNYVGSGATANGASMISDGANVTDPGNGNGQTQIVNMDFVQEVKIETSNFGADTAKGPTVITAVGKSGTEQFHGSLHISARTYQLNAQDWFQKFRNFSQIKDHYLYPGFDIQGPVVIPHTSFNSSHKLKFSGGAEDYVQRNVYAYGSLPKSLLEGLVPTKAMINGDFSQPSLANFLGVTVDDITGASGKYGAGCTPSGQLSTYLHLCASPSSSTGTYNGGGLLTNGVNGIDPGVRALLRAYYEPNCTTNDLSSCPGPGPTVINGSAYNIQTLNAENPDVYQMRGHLDYSFNENNKASITYNGQFGQTSHIPESIYYSPGTSGSAALGGVDTPGKITLDLSSNLFSANFTHIFNSRTTNEVFAAMSEVKNNFHSGNQKLLSRSYWDYPYQGIFPGASSELPSIATYSSTGASILPFALVPDFSSGPYLASKFLPSGGDNFSYVRGQHTLKLGVYLERDTANQTDLSPVTNGQISTYYLSGVTACGSFVGCSENYLADFFTGAIGSFTQQNFNAQTDLYYWTASWFATDSFKVSKRLTLDYGVRFDHLGPWQDKHGLGMATFYPSIYKTDAKLTANADGTPFLPGVRWHGGGNSRNGNAGDSSVPISGVPSKIAFVSPRFGVAFDALGNGTTIFRGGWGMFRAHDSYNDFTGPAATSEGLLTVASGGTTGSTSLTSIDLAGPALRCDLTSQTLCPSILALDPTDDQEPLTYTYSFSVSQRFPFNSVFDIAYVGNQSTHLLTDNASSNAVQTQDLRDINAVPVGSFFKPDPNPASQYFGQIFSPASIAQVQQNDYRPFPAYDHIGIPRHITYSNYNALQVQWNKQKGKLNYGLNYTFSKTLGIRGAYQNGVAGDPTNLRANYGPLSFDRSNIGTASYSYDEGAHFHAGSRFFNALANFWFISGITSLQSGPNLQAVYQPNLGVQGFANSSFGGASCGPSIANSVLSTACNINNQTILGTADVALQPILRPNALCPSGNPAQGLAKHQYINGNCFGIGPQGVNGPTNYPYLHGPAFFSSDLTIAKNVALKDNRSLQFKLAAFNFLNHPMPSFSSRFPAEANLRLYDPNNVGFSGAQLVNGKNPGGTCSDAGAECFGYGGFKTGRRVLEITARYNF